MGLSLLDRDALPARFKSTPAFCLPLQAPVSLPALLAGLAIVILLFPGGQLRAQDCFDYATAGLPLTANISTDDLVQDVVIHNDSLILIERQLGLHLYNIASPSEPVLQAMVEVGSNLGDGAMAGDFLLLTDHDYGLYVVDISTPANPVVSDSLAFENGINWIQTNGSLGACADGERNLILLDLQNPAHPVEISRIPLPATATGIAFVSNYIYATCGNSGLQIIDASIPSQPSLVNSFTVFGFCIDLAIDGNVAYILGDGYGVVSLDISDPVQPETLSVARLFGLHWGLAYAQDRVFVAAGVSGVDIVNASDPENLEYLATVPQSGHCFEAAATKTHVFVACSTSGVDISNFSESSFPGFIEPDIFYFPKDIATNESQYMYMAAGEIGLQVVDLNDPAGPKIVATLQTPGSATLAEVSDSVLIVHDDLVDVLVIDITDPLNPAISGVGTNPGESAGITTNGELALSLHIGEGISCYDISDPANTTLVSTTYVPDDPTSITLLDQYCLVTLNGPFSGLQVIDYSDPAYPVTIDWLYIPGGLTHVIAIDGYLLATGVDSTLYTIDFQNPGNLILANSFPLESTPISLTSNLQFVYLQNNDTGVVVLDISDPASPLEVGAAFIPLVANSLDFGGGFVVSNSWDRGVLLLPMQCDDGGGIVHVPDTGPLNLQGLLKAYPNPFNPRTNVVFTLPVDSAVHLEILDIRGRVIRTLVSDVLMLAGEHQIIWDGTNQQGMAAPSGIYLVRLVSPKFNQSMKLTLIR